MKRTLLLFLVLFWAVPAQAAFTHYSAFTVQSGQVTGTLTDFPVLLKPTDNRFKTTGNGGNVADAEGDDIRPYSDSSCSSALTYEKVPGTYNASTGTFEMWVKVGSLTDSSVIYLCYGDSGLTSDGSSTSTWSNSFILVLHLGDGSSLSANDATGSNNFSVSNATATTGKIDGAASFNGSSTALTKTNMTGDGGGVWTFSWWDNVSNFTGYTIDVGSGRLVVSNGDGTANAGSLGFYDGSWHSIGTAKSTSTTYYSALTLTSGTSEAFRNGSSLGTDTYTTVSNLDSSIAVGAFNTGSGAHISGWVDELRIASTVRSGAWITAEYNNQNAPGTFYSIGSEQSVGGGAARNGGLGLLGVGR